MADLKAISLNVMHSSMKITDEFYSNLNDGEVQKRINALGNETEPKSLNDQNIDTLIELLQGLKSNGNKKISLTKLSK